MDVRCERCRAQYVVDDDRVPEAGVVVTCARCGHAFRLKRKALVVTVPLGPEEARDAKPLADLLPRPAAPGAAREWRLRQGGENVWSFRELTTLQKWIVERKVSRDDEISANGDQWKRLGDIPELVTFFEVVDQAERAQAKPPPLRPGKPQPPAEGSPEWEGRAAPPPPPAIDEPLWAQGPVDRPPAPPGPGRYQPRKARRRGPWLALLALLLAAAVAGVWLYLSGTLDLLTAAVAPPDAGAPAPPAPEPPKPEAEPATRRTPAAAAQASPATTAPGSAREAERAEEPLAAPAVSSAAVSEPSPSAASEELAPRPAAAPSPTIEVAPAARPATSIAVAPPPPRPAPAPKKAQVSPAKAVRGLVAQARRLRERGKTEAALGLYAQAIDLEPTNAAALAGRGACYLEISEYPLAEANFRAALDSDPKNPEALFGMAETYRYMGKKSEAVTFYERFIAVHPDGDDAVAARHAISQLKE